MLDKPEAAPQPQQQNIAAQAHLSPFPSQQPPMTGTELYDKLKEQIHGAINTRLLELGREPTNTTPQNANDPKQDSVRTVADLRKFGTLDHSFTAMPGTLPEGPAPKSGKTEKQLAQLHQNIPAG